MNVLLQQLALITNTLSRSRLQNAYLNPAITLEHRVEVPAHSSGQLIRVIWLHVEITAQTNEIVNYPWTVQLQVEAGSQASQHFYAVPLLKRRTSIRFPIDPLWLPLTIRTHLHIDLLAVDQSFEAYVPAGKSPIMSELIDTRRVDLLDALLPPVQNDVAQFTLSPNFPFIPNELNTIEEDQTNDGSIGGTLSLKIHAETVEQLKVHFAELLGYLVGGAYDISNLMKMITSAERMEADCLNPTSGHLERIEIRLTKQATNPDPIWADLSLDIQAQSPTISEQLKDALIWRLNCLGPDAFVRLKLNPA